jgi:hypothetical protein
MSKIKQFLDQLKADNVLEAYQTIKDELSERARSLTEEVNVQVAEKFNMKRIAEEKEEKEEDDNLSDEEKEAKAAKEAAEKED